TLAEVGVQLGDHVQASRWAQSMADVFPHRPQDSYYAACFVARCIPLTKEADVEKNYSTSAVALLRRSADAVQLAGRLGKLDRLTDESKIFAPLANHAEFAAVVKRLEAP